MAAILLSQIQLRVVESDNIVYIIGTSIEYEI